MTQKTRETEEGEPQAGRSSQNRLSQVATNCVTRSVPHGDDHVIRDVRATYRVGRLGAGLILLALGTALLFGLSLPSTAILGPLGSLAAILLVLGTLGIGTTTRGRSV